MKPATTHLHCTDIDWSADLLGLHRLNPQRYPFLLESVADGNALGRFDILFACPGEALRLDHQFSLTGPGDRLQLPFLEALDHWWSAESLANIDTPLPFSGGWFVMLGYELGQQIETSLDLQTNPDLPVAMAVRVPVAIIRDRQQQRAWLVAEEGRESEFEQIFADLVTLQNSRVDARDSVSDLLAGELAEEDPELFMAAIQQAQQWIRKGDIFQANLARQWRGTLLPTVSPADIYARLRETNPAPFAGLAVCDDFAVISSSPERLLQVRGERVETRPIAGTRPRGEEPGDIRRELLGNPKERAEHVMVIDLERNDLGRICAAGSVEVDEFMVVESYAHVHHIVSNISGRLRTGTSPGNAIAAVFPGGSITGCPKVRCMQIIAELESRSRGMYTGAMGYINRDGSLDLSILIRHFSVSHNQLTFSTGCGIVADSDPELELDETRAKAKGLLMALQPDPQRQATAISEAP